MTDQPKPGSPLTAADVPLLVKGDWLRHEREGIMTFSCEGDDGALICSVDPVTSWTDDSEIFTFLGRPDADGWIEHHGGENPVPGNLVEVRYHGGREVTTGSDVQDWTWLHETVRDEDDIIAFRLASQSTAPTRGEERTHKPECWGATSFSDEKAHCYCDTAPTRGEGERFARLSLDRGAYPDDLIDHLNGYITGGSGRCREGLEGMGVVIAPTPPEPVASDLAEGESPIITGSGFQRGRGGFEVIFVDGKRYSPRRLAKALVTAEAAAARIALLTAECEASMREIALLREDADAEKARADRLAGALEKARDQFDFLMRMASGSAVFEIVDGKRVRRKLGEAVAFEAEEGSKFIREALREPKSGGGG